MRTSKAGFAAVLITLTLVSCKSVLPTSVANVLDGMGAAVSGGTQDVYVTDPTLNNMNAFRLTIPAKWHFEGTLYQGGNCVQLPSVVFRATSPDGLSLVEGMPPLGWIWGTGPRSRVVGRSDCLAMKGPMNAQDFLKYLAATMKVEYVGPEQVPAEEDAAAQEGERKAAASVAQQYAAMRIQPPKVTIELARAIVRSQNGTFSMKGLLKVGLECSETSSQGMKSILRGMADTPPSTVDKCTAGTSYTSAPERQYAAVLRQWAAPGIGGHGGEKEWFQAYVKRGQDQSDQMIATGNRMAQQRYDQSAQQFSQLQARSQQFSHDQAVRQEMHEQFLSTMQRGTDMSMARSQANMNARSAVASDWVDYALDQQTVMDPNTGQAIKVSSSYTHTWVDSSGKNAYQTNDANANPNGVLPGNWTQQQSVHGDGTPR